MDNRVKQGEAQEDQVTASIEKVTAQLPSSLFLGAAIASMIVSLALKIKNSESHNALFIGQWAAPFLILGLYNKNVKQHGSDASQESGQEQGSLYSQATSSAA